MSISPGLRLGPYEVLAPLGAGGMGEVWKARDTRLERTVYNDWVIAPDGKRFLMIKDEAAESAPKHLNLVLNWSEDLKLRAPAAQK